MTSVVFLVDQLAIGLYIVIAVGILWSWYIWGVAQREFREAYFELPRGIASYRRANAITSIILLIEAGLIVLGIQRVVVPTLQQQQEQLDNLIQSQVADGVFVTPTAQVRGEAAIDDSDVLERINATDPEQAIEITPTLTPTPVGTIIPNPPEQVGCDTENARLQVPVNGMIVFEPIDVIGQAFVEDFAFYRFELRGESTFDQFAFLAEYPQPATDITALGQFVPSFYDPGEYQFRLNVFDITGNVKATCMVNILISDPIPTPTPLVTN